MKEITLSTRLGTIMNNLVAPLTEPAKKTDKKPAHTKTDRPERLEFFYYKQVLDYDTQAVIGHLADISSGGFKLDCSHPILVNRDFRFRLDLTSEVSPKPSMAFVARSRWCQVDPLDPYVYNVGFQLIQIAPDDLEIFKRMMEAYGRGSRRGPVDLRRSNKW